MVGAEGLEPPTSRVGHYLLQDIRNGILMRLFCLFVQQSEGEAPAFALPKGKGKPGSGQAIHHG